jgi:hypothetical protein
MYFGAEVQLHSFLTLALDGVISIPVRTSFISYLKIPGPRSLLFNGHRWLFNQGQSGRGVKLTTHPYLIPRLKMTGAIPRLSIPSYNLMAGMGTTLPLPLP